MVNQGVSTQLFHAPGKITELLEASRLFNLRIVKKISHNKENRIRQVCPTTSFFRQSHKYLPGRVHIPCARIAIEYVETHSCSGSCLGDTFTFQPKFNSDYLNDAYVSFTLPEATCSEAPLPNIIVTTFDEDVMALNNGRAFNFATGTLATAAETTSNVLVHRGFVYATDNPGAGITVNDETNYTYDGRSYTIRSSNTGMDGRGGINYTYQDEHGNFIAGPDGIFAEPDLNGFGGGDQGQPIVTRANYVVAAELLGLKFNRETKWSVEGCEIDKYTNQLLLNHRELLMSKSCQRQAYDKLIGQEVPEERPVSSLRSHTGVAASGGEEGLLACNYTRQYIKLAHGLQTPKPLHESTRIHVPLAFQHNGFGADALPIAITPDVDLCYEFLTAKFNEMFYPSFGSTFIHENVVLHQNNTDDGLLSAPTLVLKRLIPVLIPGSELNDCPNPCLDPRMTHRMLYVDRFPHLCLINRLVFEPITIHRDQVLKLDKCGDDVNKEIRNAKFPTEYMFVRDYSTRSISEKLYNVYETWHRLGHIIRNPAHKYKFDVNNVPRDGGDPNFVATKCMTEYHMDLEAEPIITKMGVDIYDSSYYQKFDRYFYDTYTLFAHSEGKWHHDSDGLQALFVNFSQRVGGDGYWGSIGTSNNRKISLEMDIESEPSKEFALPDGVISSRSNIICKLTKTCIIVTICMKNFLIGSNGRFMLRFS